MNQICVTDFVNCSHKVGNYFICLHTHPLCSWLHEKQHFHKGSLGAFVESEFWAPWALGLIERTACTFL